ncbi:Rrf2 family transcriptional regulator [Bacillus infantis]|uniref:Rrf2 family transcriptional regulator n=1 Tax=Bacillus infantis TaxID=324767 RepID=UPI000B9A8299|nr:Rrf2 family transcriptional regulator [Bacillus infantis]MCK6206347.1 Rrf2 family transcriptional regulator [Bacillus infantis]OXT18517.1 transcriptional regulator [Bacillus sp. OG2]
MSISSRFSVGIHILSLIEFNKDGISSSDFLASSVNTNPAVIRKLIGMLKKAGLVEVHPGIAGAKLAREMSEITLLDVYKAVNVVQDNELFGMHENPNPDCPVGRHIQNTIEPIFSAAQLAMEKVLGNVLLEDVVKDIGEKSNIDC